MNNSCHIMNDGEVLNAEHEEYTLFHGLLYGNRVSTAKFSKRLSCSIKHLPVRVSFNYEYDTLKAVEEGVTKDPTFFLNGKVFLEGLVQAEEITQAFEKLILGNNI